ncbi:MAG TPA: HNH endonuclease signature motif containing protein, partial [Streptosporangiaceae bacterium]
GCAHIQASPAYQVPARLREFINLRDLTCRFPTCRQPAERCDADHTKPHDQDGPTCTCNLGPLCRFHHQLKQHRQWHLDQPAPGTFTWTTPTGRTYHIQPDPQAA